MQDTYEIRIDKDAVDGALANNSKHCPGNVAVVRDVYLADGTVLRYTDVKEDYIRFTANGTRYKVRTPDKLAKWLTDFDGSRGAVHPFIKFTLDLRDAYFRPSQTPRIDRIKHPRPITPARTPGKDSIRNWDVN